MSLAYLVVCSPTVDVETRLVLALVLANSEGTYIIHTYLIDFVSKATEQCWIAVIILV